MILYCWWSDRVGGDWRPAASTQRAGSSQGSKRIEHKLWSEAKGTGGLVGQGEQIGRILTLHGVMEMEVVLPFPRSHPMHSPFSCYEVKRTRRSRAASAVPTSTAHGRRRLSLATKQSAASVSRWWHVVLHSYYMHTK